MKAEQVDQALHKKFFVEDERLVFWHDPNGEFAEYVAVGFSGELADVQVLDLAEVGGLPAKLCLGVTGNDDNFIQVINYLVSREHQDGATLVRRSKCIPTDLAAVQPTSSQPSESQASGSSSLENSSRVGGNAR